MSTPYNTIRQLLDARLLAATLTGTPAIVFDNTTYAPAAQAKWLRATMLPALSGRVTMTGDKTTGQNIIGSYVIQIFTPVDIGTGDALTLADALVEWFTEETLGTALVTLVPDVIIVGNDAEGRWHQTNVNIPWRYQCL